MKAQGNRLTSHDVKKVTMLTVEDEPTEVAATAPPVSAREPQLAEEEVPHSAQEAPQPTEKEAQQPAEETPQQDSGEPSEITKSKKQKSTDEKSGTESVDQEQEATDDAPAKAKPRPDVDFEITNPDDIRVDNNGQMGLF